MPELCPLELLDDEIVSQHRETAEIQRQQRADGQNHDIGVIEERLRADQIAAVEQQPRADAAQRAADENSQQRGCDAGQADEPELGDTRRLARMRTSGFAPT